MSRGRGQPNGGVLVDPTLARPEAMRAGMAGYTSALATHHADQIID